MGVTYALMSGDDDQDAFGILRTVEQLAAFNSTARALMSTFDMPSVLEVVERTVAGLLNDCSWALWLGNEALHLAAASLDTAAVLEAGRATPPSVAPQESIASTRPIEHPNISQHSVFFSVFGPCERSVLTLPLMVRNRVLGALELAAAPASRRFTEDQRRAAAGIADLTAMAVENVSTFTQLQSLSINDEHTGCFNARHLHAEVTRELLRMSRFQRPVSLLFLDLDRFKAVNDQHGHQVGSAVLREVGDILHAAIRKCDSAFRYGGDEFAVLLLETDAESAQVVAQRIHERLRESSFSGGLDLALRLSASIGFATADPEFNDLSGAELLRRADQAMYSVKAAGRDGVACGNPPKSLRGLP